MPKMTVVYTGTRYPAVPESIRLVHWPMLQKEALPIDAQAIQTILDQPTALVFYSQHAVNAVHRTGILSKKTNKDHQFWSVGQKTAQYVRSCFQRKCHYPSMQTFEGLGIALAEAPLPPQVMAFSLQDHERDLSPILSPRDIQFVDFSVYATRPVVYLNLGDELQSTAPRWVVFTSPRGVEAFCDALGQELCKWRDEHLPKLKWAVIGPTTSEALRKVGVQPNHVASHPDSMCLLEELIHTR